MLYAIRLDPVWRPLLLIAGATRDRSFVETSADAVRLKFGPLFDATVPRSDIAAATSRRPTPLSGIGLRLGFGSVGLLGSRSGLVEIRLKTPRRFAIAFVPTPWRVGRILVSVDDPDALIADLSGAPARSPR